jgi:hypothetical protein
MKVQIKHQTMQEVEFEFPSFYRSPGIISPMFFGMYSPEKCVIMVGKNCYSETKAGYAIETLQQYPYDAITREEFRAQLTESCELLILQTY